MGANDGSAPQDAMPNFGDHAVWHRRCNAEGATDDGGRKNHLIETDGFPDWDYVPPDEASPFEYKASDWGWLGGRLVALDYSAPGL